MLMDHSTISKLRYKYRTYKEQIIARDITIVELDLRLTELLLSYFG